MQDVTITFSKGPLRGRKFEFEVGSVPIGRLPPAGGLELKDAGTSVSRLHAELTDLNGDVILQNQSPNGTTVNGKLIVDKIKLRPGSKIDIGGQYEFSVDWQTFVQDVDKTKKKKAPKKDQKPGPLASPVVRAVIGIYILGMIAVAVWLNTDNGGAVAADDWPALATAYETYHGDTLSDEERQERMLRAEGLVRELRALRTRGLDQQVDTVCREIMGIDKDSHSPLFNYGARCLSAN